MPRKKKEPVTGVSRDPENKLTVQKSAPLSALWRSDLTLSEFKILDTYLSRIDSHKPEKRAVRFEKGELERLLGVKKINTPELQARVEHLMKPLILKEGARGFRGLALFEEAVCQADENGVWQVDLECTQKAMKYFFNIESLGYLRYKLRCVAGLSSRYSYILFVYLESNRFRKSWKIGFDDLKHLLSCENEPTYQQFYRFNDRLLKRCYIELNDKTECHFTYEPVKKGRSVVAVRFTLETLPELEPVDPNQMTLFEQDRPDDSAEFLRGACHPAGSATPEFNHEQIHELLEIMLTMPDAKFPRDPATGTNDIEFRRYHYLSIQYAALNRRDTANKPIKNRFSYLLKMIKADAGMK